jgi:RNA-directed DNA polymerase
MLNDIISKENMAKAYLHVLRNKGSNGVDGMVLSDLKSHLKATWETTKASIVTESYLPKPIKGVKIPKGKGKTRLLGIPTVQDRMLQQAIHQILSPIFEVDFQEHSYGFRPNRSAQQAVKTSLTYINEGFQDVVDIDLKSFFDEVEHDLLLTLIHRKVKCKQTMCLIRRFLRAPILLDGKLCKRRKGVPSATFHCFALESAPIHISTRMCTTF